MLIPSTVDDSLAPAGCHVASLFCQQFAPELPDGRDWDDEEDAAADAILDTVERQAPGFRASIVGQTRLSPKGLERMFGLVGGDIMHGTMSRSEEHTSELQSLMRISYAVFCLKKKKQIR